MVGCFSLFCLLGLDLICYCFLLGSLFRSIIHLNILELFRVAILLSILTFVNIKVAKYVGI